MRFQPSILLTHATALSPRAQVKSTTNSLIQLTMQNLTQLEELLWGLEATLMEQHATQEAALVLRVQKVVDYVDDGQLLSDWLKKPNSYRNRASLLFYIHTLAKRLRTDHQTMPQVSFVFSAPVRADYRYAALAPRAASLRAPLSLVYAWLAHEGECQVPHRGRAPLTYASCHGVQTMVELKADLDKYQRAGRVQLKSLFDGPASAVLEAASERFAVITSDVLHVGSAAHTAASPRVKPRKPAEGGSSSQQSSRGAPLEQGDSPSQDVPATAEREQAIFVFPTTPRDHQTP